MDTAPLSSATRSAARPAEDKTAKPGSNPAISSDFETFLKMLTAQMQNQDPLNPIDSTDYAVQLATFSQVEQQVRTNDLLGALQTQFAIMGMSQMAGWVGMEAQSTGARLFDGAPIRLSPRPDAVADTMALIVRDGAGEIVDRRELPATSDEITWAGVNAAGEPFPRGLYSFEIESVSNGAPTSTRPIEGFSRVLEARNEAGELMLTLEGGAEVKAADVTALRSPDAAAVTPTDRTG